MNARLLSRSRRLLAAVALLLGAGLVSPTAHAIFDRALVHTDKGWVRGEVTPTMKKYLGIPYAAPPVGERRWRPPQPVKPWKGVRDATQFANHCPQPASPFGLASTTEDCLYLNVYTPNHKGILRDLLHDHPVMVWIHGGALFLGESDDYNPQKLVEREDVIVVTINYRLGFLGFLAHPALSAESSYGGSGNYGLMDQQAALEWVRRNIRRFGGDPNKVTIFGESAGGLSVHSQLASPLANKLFHRAIIQSGAYAIQHPTLAQAEAAGQAAAVAFGCADQSAACLRAVPVETLLANQGSGGFVPNVDGKVLPQTIRDALASGQFNQVPVMQGANHDEWRLFVALQHDLVGNPVTPANYVDAIAALGIPTPTAAFLAANVYPLAAYPSPAIALGALGTDLVFACNARTSVRLLAAHVPTYAYEFNDANAPQPFLPPVSFPYGAYHAAEIQYVLGIRPNLPPALVPPFTPDQQRLSDHMINYWGNFAKHGVPNGGGSPLWRRYDPAADVVQSLLPPTPTTKADFAADHKCGFWAPGT
nr:esterase LC-Est4 [uncultured bacterium]